MLPDESMMNRIFGFTALLAAGVEIKSSTSSATAGDATISVVIAPAIAQAKRLTDLNMCPYLFVVVP